MAPMADSKRTISPREKDVCAITARRRPTERRTQWFECATASAGATTKENLTG